MMFNLQTAVTRRWFAILDRSDLVSVMHSLLHESLHKSIIADLRNNLCFSLQQKALSYFQPIKHRYPDAFAPFSFPFPSMSHFSSPVRSSNGVLPSYSLSSHFLTPRCFVSFVSMSKKSSTLLRGSSKSLDFLQQKHQVRIWGSSFQ